MNFCHSLLIGLFLCHSMAIGQTGVDVPELRVLDDRMSQLLTTHNVVGAQLAVSYQGRLVYSRGFGYADTVSKSLVQPTSLFRVASVSKALTSAALMHLVDQGQLSLNDTVFGASGLLDTATYGRPQDKRFESITVRQLMSHSAGFVFPFPSDPIFQTYQIAIAKGDKPPTTSPKVLVQWAVKNVVLGYDPGTSASYSNFAYVVLGEVIERITGMRYTHYMADSLFSPLNIDGIQPGRTLAEDRLLEEVSYYEYAGAPLVESIYTGEPNSVPAPYGGYNWEVMTPAGGWVARAQDLCRLLVAVDGYGSKPDILQQATIDTMTKPSDHWPAYALGWNVKGDDYWHTGGIQGTAAVMHCNAEHQVTFAIISNTLPKDYGPLFLEMMSLVLDEAPSIAVWPTHDLWDDPVSVEAMVTIGRDEFLSVSPNPTTDAVRITLETPIESVRLYSATGEEVLHVQPKEAQTSIEVQLSGLARGLYWVRVAASAIKSGELESSGGTPTIFERSVVLE